jgi:hypothetical protein
LLLHAEDDRGLAGHAREPPHRLHPVAELGDVPEQDGAVRRRADDGRAELRRVRCAREVAHQPFAGSVADKAAAAAALRPLGRRGDFREGHPVRGHPVGHRVHVQLPPPAADDDHLRDAGEREEPRAHLAVGEGPQLRGAGLTFRGGEADQENLSHQRRDRAEVHLRSGGQPALGKGDAFLHQLPGAVDVLPPVEFHLNDRQAHPAVRSHPPHPGRPVERRLEWHRDERLHLLRCQPRCLRHQGDGWPVEVGKDVDGQAQQDVAAVGQHERRGRQHEPAVPQGKFDQSRQHRRRA